MKKRIKKETFLTIMLAAGFLVLVCAGLWFASRYNDKADAVSGGDEEQIVIKWMVYGEKYKASDYVFSQFNEELQKFFPDTTVEFEVISKDIYKEKWDMKMAANEVVDLAWMGSDTFNYTEEVKKGSLMALQYLLESFGQELLEEIDDDLWQVQQCDGNTYGVPVQGALYQKNYALVVNRNTADKYGGVEQIGEINRSNKYTTRECYEAFAQFLSQAKARNDLGTGISYLTFANLADKGYEGIYGGDSPFVIRIHDEELRVYNKYEQEEYQIYFDTMSEWYKEGYIRSDIADTLEPLGDDGRTGGSILFLDEHGDKGTAHETLDTDYEEVRVSLSDHHYIPYAGSRNYMVIPKSAENPQRAMEIMNLLYAEEGKELYRLLVNGIEKEHYVRLSDSVAARMSDSAESYLYTLSPYTIGNVYQNFETEFGEFEQLRVYNESAQVSPLIGFDLDTRMIAIEMAKVDLVVAEYKDILCQGTSEDWQALYEEFIGKMKEAGSEKVIQEMQRQIDEFKIP